MIKFEFNGKYYESDEQQVVAVGINHETGKALKALEPKFIILETEKGYQLKQTVFGGRKQHIKTFKTLQKVITYVNK